MQTRKFQDALRAQRAGAIRHTETHVHIVRRDILTQWLQERQ